MFAHYSGKLHLLETNHCPTYVRLQNGVKFELFKKYSGPRKGPRGLNIPADYYVQHIWIEININLDTGNICKRYSKLGIRCGKTKTVGSGSLSDVFVELPLNTIKDVFGDQYEHVCKHLDDKVEKEEEKE